MFFLFQTIAHSETLREEAKKRDVPALFVANSLLSDTVTPPFIQQIKDLRSQSFLENMKPYIKRSTIGDEYCEKYIFQISFRKGNLIILMQCYKTNEGNDTISYAVYVLYVVCMFQNANVIVRLLL